MASGRSGTANPEYRHNRALLLASNQRCWLCHHDGAATADHIISHRDWPKDPSGNPLPGFNDLTNLAPAHGTISNNRLNRCQQCGKLCNQSRGARAVLSPRSRDW